MGMFSMGECREIREVDELRGESPAQRQVREAKALAAKARANGWDPKTHIVIGSSELADAVRVVLAKAEAEAKESEDG